MNDYFRDRKERFGDQGIRSKLTDTPSEPDGRIKYLQVGMQTGGVTKQLNCAGAFAYHCCPGSNQKLFLQIIVSARRIPRKSDHCSSGLSIRRIERSEAGAMIVEEVIGDGQEQSAGTNQRRMEELQGLRAFLTQAPQVSLA